jgi:hypothetical protein
MKVISTLFLLFFLGCSQSGNDSREVASIERTLPAYESLEKEASEEVLLNDESATTIPQEQKIIKNAHLLFETQELEATHFKILQLTTQYKGYIQNDNSGKDYNRLYTNLIIRIPSEDFMKFIEAISEGVDYFDRRDISRQDVTEEFVDLEARLKAKRELENRYLELLKQAGNVKDMLEIERELSTIREEIEARQGRLQYLQNKVGMSTVSIEFYKLTSETGITQSYGQKIRNALKGGWDGISIFFLGLLYLWPIFLFGIILIIVIRLYLRKRKKKTK